jgi:chromate transporter
VIYLQLFWSFFKVGLFAIGGAYSFLPLIEREVVERHAWLTKPEFLEVSGFVKMFPGAISVKYATYVGNKTAGFKGAVIANVANLLAPAACVMLAMFFYRKHQSEPGVKSAFKAIQLVVFAMILATAFQTVDIELLRRGASLALVVVAFCLFFMTKIEPAIIILFAALLGAWFRFV